MTPRTLTKEAIASGKGQAIEYLRMITTPLYAIIDSSHGHGRIMSLIENSGCNCKAIYGKSLIEYTDGRGPYLISLHPDHGFLETLVCEGWRRAWGVFLTGDCEPRVLRRHLAKFVSVRLDQRGVALFRFHDPRVLEHYLTTCPREQLERFFGPIRSFYLQPADGEDLIRLTFEQSCHV